jgi:hypothetical protein
MTASPISTASAPTLSTPSAHLSSSAALARARAVDGDYKVANAMTSHVKDSDGDYKPLTAVKSPAAQSSSAVQAALSSLVKGG